MILRSLALQNFRNLASEELQFHATTNLIVGRNGQGKTNLLEGIYFLATTKSFRTAHLASVIRFDAPSVFVQGVLARGSVEKTLSIGMETEPRRRALMINEERVPLSRYLNAMSVFAYSSARLEILRGSPEERRRFLDRGIASVDPSYLDALARYTRVLKQRNALLQDGKTMDAWDEELAQAAVVVQKAREAYTAALSEAFANIIERHAYRVRDLQMIYRPNLLPAKRSDELRAGMTLAGPQRDHLDFVAAGRPAAEVLSGGEMKMIVLFLKFAKLDLFRARYDEPAIFLLDDVDAELDLEILEQLLLRLPPQTQVFTTSAKERFLGSLAAGPHRRLLIENGRVTAAQDFA